MSQTGSTQYPCSVPYDAETRSEWIELNVPRSEYSNRLTLVRSEMLTQNLDALLVVGNAGDPSNIAYLTNYRPHFGTTMLLITLNEEPTVVTDAILHQEPMHSMLWNVIFEDLRPAASRTGTPPGTVTQLVADAARQRGLTSSRIGIASPGILSARHLDQLRHELPQVTWEDGTTAVLKPRTIKSEREIAYMRRACQITGTAIQAGQEAIKPGVTEREVANAAHAAMLAAGAERLAFDTAVSSGSRAGLKHADPTDREMQQGDLVFLDMGAVIGGYHADVSRCVGVGSVSSDEETMLDASRTIFEAALKEVKPGKSVRDIYRAAERSARRAGVIADYMPNGLGHGVGLSLFELPFLTPDDESTLEPGMIFALEPMLVRYGVGTAVVEETVLVTEHGAEALSGMEW